MESFVNPGDVIAVESEATMKEPYLLAYAQTIGPDSYMMNPRGDEDPFQRQTLSVYWLSPRSRSPGIT